MLGQLVQRGKLNSTDRVRAYLWLLANDQRTSSPSDPKRQVYVVSAVLDPVRDVQQLADLNQQARLLLHLTDQASLDRLTELEPAARQRPAPRGRLRRALLQEQQTTIFFEHTSDADPRTQTLSPSAPAMNDSRLDPPRS